MAEPVPPFMKLGKYPNILKASENLKNL